jgi:hypothetical protein
VGWRFAADRDRHGVDGLLAVVASGDDQFAALRSRATVLSLLLDGAIRDSAGYGAGNGRIGPGYTCQRMRNSIGADKGNGTATAKPIVSGNGLLVVRSGSGRGPGVSIVRHCYVAQGSDRECMTRT